MNKPFKVRRKGIPGVYVEWYEDKRRRSKYFSPKHREFVEPFMKIKLQALNPDCIERGRFIPDLYTDAVEEYIKARQVAGNKQASITDIRKTLKSFGEFSGIEATTQVTQGKVDDFILHRRGLTKGKKTPKTLSLNTLNKYIRNLGSWIRWAQNKRRRYLSPDIEVRQVRAPQKTIRTLSNDEICRLVKAARPLVWKLRILLMAGMNLRRGELEALSKAGWSPDRRTWAIVEPKTGKSENRPVPTALVPLIIKHLKKCNTDSVFSPWSRSAWEKIIAKAKLLDITPHDLRRSYATLQAEAGTPLHTVQRLMHHSKIETTMKSYVAAGDREAIEAVDKLKIDEWLSGSSL